jgi:hypothetical protein
MAIYYLDVDDEITSAAQRIRESGENRVALVVQSGSRIASSRINFKLLAREARHHHRSLAIVAADASVRSLAEAAGLPVFSSVGEYQKTEAMRPPDQPVGAAAELGPLSTRGGGSIRARGSVDAGRFAAGVSSAGAAGTAAGPSTARSGTSSGARTSPVPATSSAAGGGKGSGSAFAGSAGGAGAHINPPLAHRNRSGRWLALGAAAALVAVLGGGYFLLPAASVTLTLEPVAVGPVTFTALVDPGVETPSPESAVVPAVAQKLEVRAGGTFMATGENVLETAAIGKVLFSSGNTFLDVPVLAGTQVSTAKGVAFTTVANVTVPRATLQGLNIVPGTAEVGVVAVVKGTGGNVDAGAIVKVPPDLATALVLASPVTNKEATTGGTRTVSLFIQQSDIDAAEQDLLQQLETAFDARLAEPGAAGQGFQLFRQGAHLGDPVYDPDPKALVGLEQDRFDLSAIGTGTALAAADVSLRELAVARVAEAAKPGFQVVAGSVTLTLGPAETVGNAVSVAVTAEGQQVPAIDEAKIRSEIGGMTPPQAEAYLSRYGTAHVSVWPFWASTVPSFLNFRVEVRIVTPTAAPTPGPGAAGASASTTQEPAQASATGAAGP